uniref:Uncharacterized protein n=1 Tax=Labrus bergylta TaxID=56723 RepID=A0A3Q3GNG5_9LABR
MIVGSSGTPQFLLTNAILGREEFPEDTTTISDSRKYIGELAGRRVAVVNAPNIYDKDISRPKRKRELRRSKCLCIPDNMQGGVSAESAIVKSTTHRQNTHTLLHLLSTHHL